MSSRRCPQYATEMMSCLCQSTDGEQELAEGLARGSSWSRSGQGCCTGQSSACSGPVVCWAVGDPVDMAGVGECREKVTHVLC